MDEDQDANINITELTADEADTAIDEAIERIERSMQDYLLHYWTAFDVSVGECTVSDRRFFVFAN